MCIKSDASHLVVDRWCFGVLVGESGAPPLIDYLGPRRVRLLACGSSRGDRQHARLDR